MTESHREIVTAYLLVYEKEPIILSSNESKIDDIINKASIKNITLKKQKITTNKNRIHEMGKNFFEKSIPKEIINDPVTFRNKLISEWHTTISRLSDTIKVDGQLSWNKICKKYNFCECTVEEFSVWMLDIREYLHQ
jgi:hypothetical protein